MQFSIAGRDVGSVDLVRDCRTFGWRRLEFSGILAGQGDAHKLHPDREGSMASRLFVAERFFFVEADPNAAGQGGRKTDEPCVGEIVRRSGFSRERIGHFGGCGRGPVKHHVP